MADTVLLDNTPAAVPSATRMACIGNSSTTGAISITTSATNDLVLSGGTTVDRPVMVETTGIVTTSVGRDLIMTGTGGSGTFARIIGVSGTHVVDNDVTLSGNCGIHSSSGALSMTATNGNVTLSGGVAAADVAHILGHGGDITLIATSGNTLIEGGALGNAIIHTDTIPDLCNITTKNLTIRTGADSDAAISAVDGNITVIADTILLDHRSSAVPTTSCTSSIGGTTTTGTISLTTAANTDMTITGGSSVNRPCIVKRQEQSRDL